MNKQGLLTRKKILDITNKSNAAHIGAAFSVVDILRAVYRSVDINKIKNNAADRDRVILSKGHSAAALYTTLLDFGLMEAKDHETYNQNGSLLSGHVSHFVKGVEHSTGALGHGLPVALGIALGLRSKDMKSKVFVILGDGEMHEGANWEAIMQAGHLKMSNLCVLVDNNHLSQIGRTEKCCNLNPFKVKFESFNFKAFDVDGHNDEAIYQIIQKEHGRTEAPLAIICQTIKGKGVSFMEDNNIWHYRTPKGPEYEKAVMELEGKNS